MTILEDFSGDALDEVVSLLKSRVAKYGECQISTSAIAKTITERVGGGRQATRYLLTYVCGFLEGTKVLVPWSRNTHAIIYTVDPQKLSAI